MLPSEDGRSREIATHIGALAEGDREALRRLIPLVYDDLRRIAHDRLRGERGDHTLETTAVVHEAYLRLSSDAHGRIADENHFFALCSKIIRNLIVDHARRRGATRRGGEIVRIPLRQGVHPDRATRDTVELLALDEALTALARHDELMERVVECRFFGGLTVDETSASLGISRRTCERAWTRARIYLYRELTGGPPPADD